MFYVYIIQSQMDDSFYIGYSNDVLNRLLKHNTAKSGYTSRKQPWELKYTEQFENKSDAIKREKFLKRQKNREFYQNSLMIGLVIWLVRIRIPSHRKGHECYN